MGMEGESVRTVRTGIVSSDEDEPDVDLPEEPL